MYWFRWTLYYPCHLLWLQRNGDTQQRQIQANLARFWCNGTMVSFLCGWVFPQLAPSPSITSTILFSSEGFDTLVCLKPIGTRQIFTRNVSQILVGNGISKNFRTQNVDLETNLDQFVYISCKLPIGFPQRNWDTKHRLFGCRSNGAIRIDLTPRKVESWFPDLHEMKTRSQNTWIGHCWI